MLAKDIINSIKDVEGLTFAQLADAIGVHPSQFYEIQNGKTKNISATLAVKIFNAFPHYSLEFLLTGNTSSTTIDIPTFDKIYTMPSESGLEPIISPGDKLALRRWDENFFIEDEWYAVTLATGDTIIRKLMSQDDKIVLSSPNKPSFIIERDDAQEIYIVTSITRIFYR